MTRTSIVASLRRGAVMAGLTGIAIAQPLLSSLGDSPTSFTARHVTGSPIIWFALAVVFVPLLAVWAITEVGGKWLHLGAVGALSALATVQFAREADIGNAWGLAMLAVAAGSAMAVAYRRLEPLRLWLQLLAVVPLVALGSFLFASDTSDLINQRDQVAADIDTEGPVPPVVVLLLDELPTKTLLGGGDTVDAELFPNLAAFADTSTFYRDFTTVSPFTATAVPAILTGRFPTGGPPLSSEHPDNLFSLLAGTHHLTVSEALTDLCAFPACEGPPLPPGVEITEADPNRRLRDLIDTTAEVWLDKVNPWARRKEALDDFVETQESTEDSAEPTPSPSANTTPLPPEFDLFIDSQLSEQPVRFSEMTEAITDTDEPVLYFLHLVLPHHPWTSRPDGEQYSTPSGDADPFDPVPGDDWIVRLNHERHIEQSQYADRLVGEFLSTLQQKHQFDDSIVIVAADHGVDFELGEHHREFDAATVDGVAYAPLFIKAPGQTQGVVDDANVLSIDLLPRIADLLGIEIPWSVDGVVDRTGREKVFYDYRDAFEPELEDVVTYEDDFAAVAEPLPRLYDGVAGAELIGTPLTATQGEDTASVVDLAGIEHPGGVLPGVIVGQTDAEGTIVAALNDTIVGLSPTFDLRGTSGRFAMLIPQGLIDSEANTVRLAQLIDGALVELEVG